jgi:hypothetical protein
MSKLTVGRMSQQCSLMYSNVPTAKEPWDFIGSKTNSIRVFLPGVGDLHTGFIAVSHGNALTISLQSDMHYVKYPDEFIQIVGRNIDDFIANGSVKVA